LLSLRPPASALSLHDALPICLSPKAVRLFILGSRSPVRCGGQTFTIRKKYLGNDALVERCIITLAGNRGLMLVGEPGTAKTMLSDRKSTRLNSSHVSISYAVF